MSKMKIPSSYDLAGYRYTTLDRKHYLEQKDHKWKVMYCKGTYYIRRESTAAERANGDPLHIYLHREILGLPRRGGPNTDHIDGNSFNNYSKNLRTCTNSQNQLNKKPRNGLYHNVSRNKSKEGGYIFSVNINGKRKVLFKSQSAEECALKSDEWHRSQPNAEFYRGNFKAGTKLGTATRIAKIKARKKVEVKPINKRVVFFGHATKKRATITPVNKRTTGAKKAS